MCVINISQNITNKQTAVFEEHIQCMPPATHLVLHVPVRFDYRTGERTEARRPISCCSGNSKSLVKHPYNASKFKNNELLKVYHLDGFITDFNNSQSIDNATAYRRKSVG